MAALRAARILMHGGLLAHATGTVAGVAAALHPEGIRRLQFFKGRTGPFLLLADSISAALALARRKDERLRRIAEQLWPGPVTLVFAARPHLPRMLLPHGRVAVRVDSDELTRLLCRKVGGLLVSSSLNRRGGEVQEPCRRLRWRWHRHLAAVISGPARRRSPSAILLWKRGRLRPLRLRGRETGAEKLLFFCTPPSSRIPNL